MYVQLFPLEWSMLVARYGIVRWAHTENVKDLLRAYSDTVAHGDCAVDNLRYNGARVLLPNNVGTYNTMTLSQLFSAMRHAHSPSYSNAEKSGAMRAWQAFLRRVDGIQEDLHYTRRYTVKMDICGHIAAQTTYATSAALAIIDTQDILKIEYPKTHYSAKFISISEG